MSQSALAALCLAVAVGLVPGSPVASGRVASICGQDGTASAQARGGAGPWLSVVAAVVVAIVAVVLLGGVTGAVLGTVLGAGSFAAFRWLTARRPQARSRAGRRPVDPLAVAARWDLLAACLLAGLPVPTAVHAVADGAPAPIGGVLRHVGELLMLGADPVAAWAPALRHAETAALARSARRTARSGAALAGAAVDLAAEVRAAAIDHAEARAQRAAVLIVGPLGLCFLPAFLCLGVLPVVIELIGGLLTA
ncbi:type II secretion system protein [Solihabitans fulvus]|uniref:Type II secretion system protein n=1 Tax=Solihabitans fulvus TaxID=1892852 RepID=A0A5B2XGU8_9PSEU|nr:type II secretion system F family protein [Solihabitans fulvus]KAA2262275.1 type II secretion system protein [Solihabitans fulvus]